MTQIKLDNELEQVGQLADYRGDQVCHGAWGGMGSAKDRSGNNIRLATESGC
ncbi:hypothetical protein ACLJYM_27185 [Rhizobium giardinii]|uniref:hypothetical protein n=1 Tax=Rhizobium giardinii TaxID=56731 RepID=UPI0013AF0386